MYRFKRDIPCICRKITNSHYVKYFMNPIRFRNRKQYALSWLFNEDKCGMIRKLSTTAVLIDDTGLESAETLNFDSD